MGYRAPPAHGGTRIVCERGQAGQQAAGSSAPTADLGARRGEAGC